MVQQVETQAGQRIERKIYLFIMSFANKFNTKTIFSYKKVAA